MEEPVNDPNKSYSFENDNAVDEKRVSNFYGANLHFPRDQKPVRYRVPIQQDFVIPRGKVEIPEYNGLKDKHCRGLYYNNRLRKYLQTKGLITNDNHVIERRSSSTTLARTKAVISPNDPYKYQLQDRQTLILGSRLPEIRKPTTGFKHKRSESQPRPSTRITPKDLIAKPNLPERKFPEDFIPYQQKYAKQSPEQFQPDPLLVRRSDEIQYYDARFPADKIAKLEQASPQKNKRKTSMSKSSSMPKMSPNNNHFGNSLFRISSKKNRPQQLGNFLPASTARDQKLNPMSKEELMSVINKYRNKVSTHTNFENLDINPIRSTDRQDQHLMGPDTFRQGFGEFAKKEDQNSERKTDKSVEHDKERRRVSVKEDENVQEKIESEIGE